MTKANMMTFSKLPLLPALGTLLFGIPIASQAALVTWDNGGGGNAFETAANWDTDNAPVSGVDDVLIGSGIGNAQLNSTFEIGSGRTFTGTGSQAVLRLGAGSDLIVKTGGTLDFSGAIFAEAGNPTVNPQKLTIESGATVSFASFFDANEWVTTWKADAAGATVITVTGNFFHRGEFVIDLTNYDLSNGTTVVFADYNTYSPQGGESFTVLGKSGTIDTAYDLGGGDLGLAVTNIIPEPGTISLSVLSLLGMLSRRRRG